MRLLCPKEVALVMELTGKPEDEAAWALEAGICIMPIPGVLVIAMPLVAGAAMLHQFTAKEVGGKVRRDAGHDAIAWCFDNIGVSKLVGFTPASNRAACLMAAWCGFKREGLLRKARVEGGPPEDVVVFGLCKDEWEESENG